MIDHNLHFLCTLIESIGRKTKNKRSIVVNKIGKEELQHIYTYAESYHTDPLEATVESLSLKYNISEGTFDNIMNCHYDEPTETTIGKVFHNFVLELKPSKETIIDTLIMVFNSFVADLIEDYNCSMYYEFPDYHVACLEAGEVLT